jgi:hypothetical protein
MLLAEYLKEHPVLPPDDVRGLVMGIGAHCGRAIRGHLPLPPHITPDVVIVDRRDLGGRIGVGWIVEGLVEEAKRAGPPDPLLLHSLVDLILLMLTGSTAPPQERELAALRQAGLSDANLAMWLTAIAKLRNGDLSGAEMVLMEGPESPFVEYWRIDDDRGTMASLNFEVDLEDETLDPEADPSEPKPALLDGPREFTRLYKPGEFTRSFEAAPAEREVADIRLPASPALDQAAEQTQSAVVDRTLDLALAATAPVLKPLELIALLRLPNSVSLGELLNADRDSDLRSDSVRSRNFGLEFLRDASGALRPVDVTMQVRAPDFDPPIIQKTVRVRPDRDAERQVFLLTPQKTGPLLVQFDVLMGDVTVASRSLKTLAEPSDRMPTPQVVVSVPLELRVTPRKRWLLPAIAAAVLLAGAATWILTHPAGRATEEWASARSAVSIAQAHSFDTEPRLAVIAGIRNYGDESGLNALRYSDADASAIAGALGKHGYTTQTFLNSDARADRIRHALEEDRLHLGPGSGTILFYFSGHGLQSDDDQYLMTAGASVDNLQLALPIREVRALLEATNARQKVVLIDACRNNPTRLASKDVTSTGPAGLDRLRSLESANGLFVLNSTAPGQRSWEYDDLKHGLFTAVLLEAVNGDVKSKDDYLSFMDLALYTFYRMNTETLAKQAGGPHRQAQNSWHSGEGSGDFLLVKLK